MGVAADGIVVAGAGLLCSLLAWFAVRWVNGLIGRLKRVEDTAVTHKDLEHLDKSITELKVAVNDGIKSAAQQNGELRREVQDLGRYHTERVSALVRDLHKKVEDTDVRLRKEIDGVRQSRAAGGD